MEKHLKDKKREAWDSALAIQKLDGWEPDNEFKKLIEKDINGEISTEDIIKITINKYKK
jgi:hypothetical protein